MVKDISIPGVEWCQAGRDSFAKKHILSHMSILGNRVLISYEGQPVTCYGCNAPGHQYQECPHRRQAVPPRHGTEIRTWADIVTKPKVEVANTEEKTLAVITVTNDDV